MAYSIKSSSSSTLTESDLPNLPGLRRTITNPTLLREFKASIASSTTDDFSVFDNFEEDRLLKSNSMSQFLEGSSRINEINRILTPYQSEASAFNDHTGRYSLRSQQRDRLNKTKSLPYINSDSAPMFVTDDGKRVIRFKAYFEEIVPENLTSQSRAREVEIVYYMNDDTIEVFEPRVRNSGLMQGKFLKRHQIRKPLSDYPDGYVDPLPPRVSTPSNLSSDLYTLDDFRSGSRLNFYGRIFTIIDCDNIGRNFFEDVLGRSFGPPLPLPETFLRPKTPSTHTPRTAKTGLGLGQTSTIVDLSFFQNDRKVLRFFGVWDDRMELFGDKHLVEVHYYLADNKVEVVPSRGHFLDNSGRDRLSKYLKKASLFKEPPSSVQSSLSSRPPTHNNLIQKRIQRVESVEKMLKIGELPAVNSRSMARKQLQSINPPSTPSLFSRGGLSSSSTLSSSSSADSFGEFNSFPFQTSRAIPAITSAATAELTETSEGFRWENFQIGTRVSVAGLSILLTDADPFTREYFLDQGRPLGPPCVLESDDDKFLQRAKTSLIRPLTGEADALASKDSFMHIPPPKDGVKAKLFQGMVLRYQARFITDHPPDIDRRFVLQFYLEDDSLSVLEPPRRNSGHLGGPYLGRERIGNPKNNRYYQPRDFFVGAEILVFGKKFLIEDADDYTIKYMEVNNNQWRLSDLKAVLSKCQERGPLIRQMLLTLPGLSSRHVTCDQLLALLQEAGMKALVKQEAVTIFRACQDRLSSNSVSSTSMVSTATLGEGTSLFGSDSTIKLSKFLGLMEGYRA